jgi:hypothetical protein
MSSEYSEVRKVVGELAKIMRSENCVHFTLSPEVYCKMLYSLRFMSSEHNEVRQLLGALLPHITSSLSTPEPGQVQDLSTEAAYSPLSKRPTRQFIKHSHHRQIKNDNQISGKNIGNAFYGLYGSDMRHEIVRDVVRGLMRKYELDEPLLDERDGDSIFQTIAKFEERIVNPSVHGAGSGVGSGFGDRGFGCDGDNSTGSSSSTVSPTASNSNDLSTFRRDIAKFVTDVRNSKRKIQRRR